MTALSLADAWLAKAQITTGRLRNKDLAALSIPADSSSRVSEPPWIYRRIIRVSAGSYVTASRGRQLCDEVGLQPTVFYRQKEFFMNGAAAFEQKARPRTPLSLEDSRCRWRA